MNAITYPSVEAWRADGVNFLGASEAAAILGKSPWMDAAGIYARKLGLVAPKEETEAMEAGILLEPVVCELYRRRSGRQAELQTSEAPVRLIHPEYPFIAATLDAYTWREGVKGNLQLKSSSAFASREWSEGVPLHYRIQVQQEMAVSGLPFSAVAALVGGNRLVWFDEERNEGFIGQVLLPSLVAFWECLQAGTPPEPSAATSPEVLRRVFRQEDEEIVSLPGALMDLDDERERLLLESATATARIGEIEGKIIKEIGKHAAGVLPNGVRYTYRAKKPGALRSLRRSTR